VPPYTRFIKKTPSPPRRDETPISSFHTQEQSKDKDKGTTRAAITMVGHKNNSFEDDEPLLPLNIAGRISDASTANQHTKDTSAKVSGSTAHESKSSSSSSGTINETKQSSCHHDHSHGHDHSHSRDHHHRHQHSHSYSHSSDDVHARRPPGGGGEGGGATEEELDEEPLLSDDEDEPVSLEALRESEKDKRRLKIAIALCSTFFVVELLGGLWAESLALLSDSFHLLTGKLDCFVRHSLFSLSPISIS
jgi:hypothetical protein